MVFCAVLYIWAIQISINEKQRDYTNGKLCFGYYKIYLYYLLVILPVSYYKTL